MNQTKTITGIAVGLIAIMLLMMAIQPHDTSITPEQFESYIQTGSYTIIDIRTPEEIAQGKITNNALEIDFYDDDFRDELSQLDPNDNYLIYCRSGNRSGQTLEILDELGFKNTYDLDGGITAWQEYKEQ